MCWEAACGLAGTCLGKQAVSERTPCSLVGRGEAVGLPQTCKASGGKLPLLHSGTFWVFWCKIPKSEASTCIWVFGLPGSPDPWESTGTSENSQI